MTGRWLSLLPLAMLGVACGDIGNQTQELQYSGATMGTTFSVSIVHSAEDIDITELQSDIDDVLQQIEKTMSTYDAESELSRFNASTSTEWVPVSGTLCGAIEHALELARFTDGAFDITVGPLVNLWGFGPAGVSNEPPSNVKIQVVRSYTGFEKLDADCTNARIRKSAARVYVDLSAYAKGLAVDWLADVLLAHNHENFLVEIGGEVRVHGTNGSDNHWRVAIEKPLDNERAVEKIIPVSGGAIATSGDYRNFFEYDGKRYSHTIDPRTGRPVDHQLAAVTVMADKAATADALATSLLVMGPDAGPVFANEHDIAALFLIHRQGTVEEKTSAEFEQLQAL